MCRLHTWREISWLGTAVLRSVIWKEASIHTCPTSLTPMTTLPKTNRPCKMCMPSSLFAIFNSSCNLGKIKDSLQLDQYSRLHSEIIPEEKDRQNLPACLYISHPLLHGSFREETSLGVKLVTQTLPDTWTTEDWEHSGGSQCLWFPFGWGFHHLDSTHANLISWHCIPTWLETPATPRWTGDKFSALTLFLCQRN